MCPLISLKFKNQRKPFVFGGLSVLFLFCLIAIFPLYRARAAGVTYYVDNSCANNGNGAAQTCAASAGAAGPFNSIANAQSAVTGNQSGNSLLLKAGETFREQYTVPAWGTSGSPFTIGTYGTGASPIVDGLNPVASSSWMLSAVTGINFTSGYNLDGWWRFASSTNLGLDSSSQGNTLTVNGSISQVAGPNAYVPEAVSLNGASSQYFSIPNSSLSTGFPGKSGQESFTVGEWVDPATSTNGTMMETLVEGCTFSLDFAGWGNPLFQIDDNSWGGHQAVGTVYVPTGTWSQIVGVWNQSTGALQIYFNGVNVTASPASSTTAVVNGFPLTIGEPSTCNVNNYYTGAIAEPFVIAAALTAAQVQNIYNYGVIDL